MQRMIVVFLALGLVLTAAVVIAGEGAVTGKLQIDSGKPLDNGIVFFFSATGSLERPVLGKFWRVPDFVDRTDAEGSFTTVLPDAEYYIAAIKRHTEVSAGPPVDGDYFLPSHNQKGQYRRVTVKDGETTDLGVISGITRYSSRHAVYKGKVTTIEGKLTRADGSPVAGMLVFAYRTPEQRERPIFVSTASEKDGRYRLPLDKGRVVYLKARESYAGGSPQPGTLIGFYGDADSLQPVAARANTVLKNIDIVVNPFAQRVK